MSAVCSRSTISSFHETKAAHPSRPKTSKVRIMLLFIISDVLHLLQCSLLLNRDALILKICDFGTACDKKTFMTNNKGSSAWMAPEVFKGNDYSEKCDIFSWAIILWQCLSRRQPFNKYENEYAIQWSKVVLGKKPPMLNNCPSKIKDLLTNCWNQDPEIRPSMNEIVPLMEELFSHCSAASLQPLNLVPTRKSALFELALLKCPFSSSSDVKEGKVIISNFSSYVSILFNKFWYKSINITYLVFVLE